MPSEVRADEARQAVVIRVWGEAFEADHLASREEAVRLLTDRGFSRLLVDLREADVRTMSTADVYHFAAETARVIPYECRVAHLLPANVQVRADVMFVSTVEHNRGRLVAEFESEAAAWGWLARA